jgi:hypothetical protein
MPLIQECANTASTPRMAKLVSSPVSDSATKSFSLPTRSDGSPSAPIKFSAPSKLSSIWIRLIGVVGTVNTFWILGQDWC